MLVGCVLRLSDNPLQVALTVHGRVLAARKLGLNEVPVIELAGMTEAQKRRDILDEQTERPKFRSCFAR